VTELQAIENWLQSKLSADPTISRYVDGRIYAGLVSSGSYPCIVYDSLDPRDIVGVGSVRIATAAMYLVKAVGKDGFSDIDPIAARIDELLHCARVDLGDGGMFSCLRDRPFSMTEPPAAGGTIYRSRGGIYRFLVHD